MLYGSFIPYRPIRSSSPYWETVIQRAWGFAHCHTAFRWQSWHSYPGILFKEYLFIYSVNKFWGHQMSHSLLGRRTSTWFLSSGCHHWDAVLKPAPSSAPLRGLCNDNSQAWCSRTTSESVVRASTLWGRHPGPSAHPHLCLLRRAPLWDRWAPDLRWCFCPAVGANSRMGVSVRVFWGTFGNRQPTRTHLNPSLQRWMPAQGSSCFVELGIAS